MSNYREPAQPGELCDRCQKPATICYGTSRDDMLLCDECNQAMWAAHDADPRLRRSRLSNSLAGVFRVAVQPTADFEASLIHRRERQVAERRERQAAIITLEADQREFDAQAGPAGQL